jgi:hypothetical protein
MVRQLSDAEREDLDRRAERRRRPAPLPRPAAQQALLGASKFERVASVHDEHGWLAFLSPHFDGAGAANLTGTYSDAYARIQSVCTPAEVVADFRRGIECFQRGDLTVPWCVGVELAPQGRLTGRTALHFHAMLGGVWSEAQRDALEAFWASTRGHAKCKAVSDLGGCVGYCAKHLLKSGAVDYFEFSLGWQARRPSRHARREALRLAHIASGESRGSRDLDC